MKKFYFLMLALFAAISASAATMYFENTKNWTSVDMYSWTDSNNNAAWPGVTLTETTEINGKTYYVAESDFKMVIFSTNNGNTKAGGDLQVVDKGIYNCDGFTNTTIDGGDVTITTEVYLAGKFNGYKSSDPACKFTSTDDKNFTYEYDGSFSSDFKVIVNGSWLGTTTPVVSGTEYALSDIGMNNSKLAESPATNVVFNFNVENNTLVVTYDAEGGEDPTPGPTPTVDYTKWYVNVIGEYNDWKDNGIQPDAEGLSKHTALKIGTEGFKVKIWDGTADVYYSTGGEIAQGEWVKIEGNASASMTIAGATAGQEFDVEFDCANTSIKVTAVGGGDEPDPGPAPADEFTYGIHGDIFGVTEWSTENMTFTDGKWVLADKEVIAGSFGIKQMDESGEQSLWYASAAGATVVLDQPLAAIVNGNNWNIKAGTYTFTFDPEALTLTVTGVESVDPNPVYPESLYVIGDELNGAAWLVNFVELSKTAEGVFETTEGITVGGSMGGEFGYIQFCTEKGEDWNSLGTRYAADAAGVTIEANVPVTVAKTSEAFAIAPGVYNLTVDLTANTLTATKRESGVTGVEADSNAPAVYYNLQGVEVAEPANGLFIEVRGNATRKVLVK